MEYLAHLSKILVKNMVLENKYHEKLIENSAVCNSGIWD